ncbi:hypothetical protein GCM10018793_70810 [Streptomyces sulfonofaciens]|uniref:Uncharacterized protein n=1 Tax=Streptomyces sulfonofaciens TaxID=68272 RepID=A0A919GSK1_9ACTN|nr:hypothetical protein GCM10018793_70810 [Streptomyces sulfonofaciens]
MPWPATLLVGPAGPQVDHDFTVQYNGYSSTHFTTFCKIPCEFFFHRAEGRIVDAVYHYGFIHAAQLHILRVRWGVSLPGVGWYSTETTATPGLARYFYCGTRLLLYAPVERPTTMRISIVEVITTS